MKINDRRRKMKYLSYREIGIKGCGLLAIIAMFLPFIVEDYYQISIVDIFFGMNDVNVSSPELMAYVILLLFALIMAIAVIVLNEEYVIAFALAGLLLTLLARFLPEMVIKHYLNGTVGSSIVMGFLQFGSGWWIMLLAFAVAAAGGFIAKKQVSHRE
ncbi:MAG: hypothetical protein ACLT01_00750 [Clostridia bacterium]